jgi:hypothetical protein
MTTKRMGGMSWSANPCKHNQEKNLQKLIATLKIHHTYTFLFLPWRQGMSQNSKIFAEYEDSRIKLVSSSNNMLSLDIATSMK